MDALRSLIEGVLPPAGNPIVLARSGKHEVSELFPGASLTWTDSGTSALALALLDIRAKHPDIQRPEVIIPAYCCPDLVSAAIYSGFTPVVSDLAENSCHYDLAALPHRLSEQTLAIIAVNFLGLAPPTSAIRSLIENRSVDIIEDNAQWFPGQPQVPGFQSDYQTFSFGRGKPVNLLCGGLVLSRSELTVGLTSAHASTVKRLLYYGKCNAYNKLLQPQLYQWLARNPFIKLGSTIYHPLTEISSMAAHSKALVSSNVRAYWSHKRLAERTYIERLSDVNDLAPHLDQGFDRLLRFPLLLKSNKARERLLTAMDRKGLGATALYAQTIDKVEDVPAEHLDAANEYPNAESFSQRFMTLPLHEGVTQRHIEETLSIVNDIVQ